MSLAARGHRLLVVTTVAALLLVILAACGGASRAAPLKPPVAAGTRPVLVINSPEAAAWTRLLRDGGLSAMAEPIGYLDTNAAAVLPEGVHFRSGDESALRTWVRNGGRLVTSDPGVLRLFGASFGRAVTLTSAEVAGLAGTSNFVRAAVARPMTVKEPGAVVLSHSGAVNLMMQWPSGKGTVLGMAVDPFSSGQAGYEIFPTLAAIVGRVTGAPPGPTRQGIEVYLDPGVLPPSVEYNVQAVAAMAQGAKAVNLAAWDTDFTDPAKDYPYAQLIAALHARGILVYAWLEPPFVTLAMWEEHPECREKTETGVDAHPYWRYLMSLETPSCFRLAWQQWSQVLDAFPWDGVNVAEMYFESPVHPSAYTPFSAGALALFGKNPAEDPAGFAQFRTNLVTSLNKQILDQLNGLPKASSMEFELTVIDSLLDPVEARDVGSDTPALAGVASSGGASLEVEDPYTQWYEGPLRYTRITTELHSLAAPGNALIDLNVVSRPGARPTATMTGGELDLATATAATYDGRVAIYALGTISATDLASMPAAAAGSVQTTYTGVVTPWTVTVHAPAAVPHTRVTVDGVAWPTSGGAALVPAGQHSVSWSGGPPAGPGLSAFSGELSTASVTPTAIRLAYFSRSAAYAIVDRQPSGLTVDGSQTALVVAADPSGGWSVRLPSGTHHVTLSFS